MGVLGTVLTGCLGYWSHAPLWWWILWGITLSVNVAAALIALLLPAVRVPPTAWDKVLALMS